MTIDVRLCRVSALALAVVLLAVAPLGAKSNVSEFECFETPLGIIQPPEVHVTPSGNMHLRGMVSQYEEYSLTEPRLNGVNSVEVNANWDADGHGPMWGTFINNSTAGDGAWEGTWEGQLDADGVTYHATGKGTGAYAGMKLWIDVGPSGCSGRILDHD
jgi:hypothetical protein